MDEVNCEKAIEIFTNEQLLVQITVYDLIVDVLEQRRESNGLVNGFSTQLELVIGTYYAELAIGFDHETYGKLTFIVLIFYTGFNHSSSGQKMAQILVIIGIDVFMEDFQSNFQFFIELFSYQLDHFCLVSVLKVRLSGAKFT